jgi:hypothetical protein
MNDSTSQDHSHSCPRPASPFFRHRPLGRAPSPPTWACYEQIPARSDLLGSSDSDSDSGDAADEDSLSDADSSSSSDDAEAEAEAAGLMDVESDKDVDADADAASPPHPHPHSHPAAAASDPEKRDKGKQRAEDPPLPPSSTDSGKSVPVAHPRSRRPRGRRPTVSVLRPILTIQRSQGFVWNQVRCVFLSLSPPPCPPALLPHLVRPNMRLTTKNAQDLFVPPYIKDRCTYIYPYIHNHVSSTF